MNIGDFLQLFISAQRKVFLFLYEINAALQEHSYSFVNMMLQQFGRKIQERAGNV